MPFLNPTPDGTSKSHISRRNLRKRSIKTILKNSETTVSKNADK
jgi:hypothetical protein